MVLNSPDFCASGLIFEPCCDIRAERINIDGVQNSKDIKMKFVADDKIPFLMGALEPCAEICYLEGAGISAADVKNADALIIRTRTRCNKDLLEGSKISFIATATIGFDHIDVAYCKEQDIDWENAPGCNSKSVEQYISSALLRLAKDNNFTLKHKTIGIVGVGNVGSKIEKITRLWGMKVLLNDPPREREEGSKAFVSLKEILSSSDFITLHVPLNKKGTDKTFHLVDKVFLSSMKKSSYILNTSRGSIINNADLEAALKTGEITGAVLDVWEHEPGIDKELLDIVDIATPHIAGYSADGKALGTTMSVRNLSRYFNLGLDNWVPGNIFESDGLDLKIDCKGKSKEEIIFEAVNATYNIRDDEARLREAPETFERLRAGYPVRREFAAYTLTLEKDQEDCRATLESMGFTIKL